MNNIIKKIYKKILFISNNLSDVILEKKYPLLNPRVRKKAMGKGALGVVLMLHRVAEYDKSRLAPNEDLKISPAFLQKTIDKYRKAGFTFLSLDAVYDIITGKDKIDKPFVAFTDDKKFIPKSAVVSFKSANINSVDIMISKLQEQNLRYFLKINLKNYLNVNIFPIAKS